MKKPLSTLSALSSLLFVALAGCTGAEPAETSGGSELLAPPPSGQGVQLRMESTIAPGEERELCQFFVVPPGGLNLNREIVRFREGSHHVVLFNTTYSAVPAANLEGEAVDTSGVFDCTKGVLGVWDITGFVAGAQSPDAPEVVLPEGVAIRIPEGAVMLMNTHYLNATPEPMETDTRINLYSVPPGDVKEEAGFLTFYDPFISVPAMGSSTSRMRCPVPHDVKLVTLTSHMHRLGSYFNASVIGEGGEPQETLYETEEWDDVPTSQWLPGKAIAAGSSIEFRCEYKNPTSDVVTMGPTTKDEMCGLFGVYYPRDPGFEVCSSVGLESPGHEATWYGDGESTCLQAIQCLSSSAGTKDAFGCVAGSCPASGPALSELIHCQDDATRGEGSPCGAVCQTDAVSECQSCILELCGDQLAACVSAKCE